MDAYLLWDRPPNSEPPFGPEYLLDASKSRQSIDPNHFDDPDATPTPSPTWIDSQEASPNQRWVNSDYAVFRPTPLVSPWNQPLVDELECVRMHRRLTRDAHSEMAYLRAASAVKAVPYPLKALDEMQLKAIKGIGPKMITVIQQFYEHGYIPEAEIIRNDRAVQTMFHFMKLHGVGPHMSERLYKEGCRTLEDVILARKMEFANRLGPSISLTMLPDLLRPIPRAQVECIRNDILRVLDGLVSNAQAVIVGGYRRGKELSGDVDLVVSSSSEESATTLLHALVHSLRDAGKVSHTLALSRHTEDHRLVDVAEIVYTDTSSGKQMHRRVDIVYAVHAYLGAAILAWTGSSLYERDLRRWAQTRGYSVRAGCLHKRECGLTMKTSFHKLDCFIFRHRNW